MRKRTMKAPGLFGMLLAMAMALPAVSLSAQNPEPAYDLEEVTVTATPRENTALEEQPLSYTRLSRETLEKHDVTSIKDLSGMVPGFFIPSYGSKQTTAVYIRGVGSRINTPAVALYVDNIPYVNKSAYDFAYANLSRIDVLKGPQATLYGRNAMAGVVNVYTEDPFHHEGTILKMGAATYGGARVSLSHQVKVSDRFAFSLSGFWDYKDGFFRNEAKNGAKADRSREEGGRFRGVYLPKDNTRMDLTLSYEHLSQGAFPYAYTGSLNGIAETREDMIGKISYDGQGAYRRDLLNAGLQIQHDMRYLVLSSISSYQHLGDRMDMDQDYTELPIFNLIQRQKSHTATQELVLKTRRRSRWDWVTGISATYSSLKTNAPVSFLDMGVRTLIEDNVNGIFECLRAENPRMPEMMLDIRDGGFEIPGHFSTPTMNLGLYHQTTINDILVDGLSLVLGGRLQYEKDWIHYDSRADVGFDFLIPGLAHMPQMAPVLERLKNLEVSPSFLGRLRSDDLVFLPKAALEYHPSGNLKLYLSYSKGYRSKGYNAQMFSDLVQDGLSSHMMAMVDERSGGMISRMGMPVEVKETTPEQIADYVGYKPEQSHNLEAGMELDMMDGRLHLSAAGFLMRVTDLQINKFSENGMGRITINAGRSRSLGLEAAARYQATDRLTLNASWGYTDATFRDYQVGETVSYRGNHVPYVPRHTLFAGASYRLPFSTLSFADALVLDASYKAMGRIYWNESNTASQGFYGTLNLRATLEKGAGSLSLWVDNVLDRDYAAFYFESLGKGLRQKGAPLQVGLDLTIRF